MSQATGRTLTPNSLENSLAVASRFFIFREVRTKSAPASASPVAINFPIPLPPPVTRATLPLSLNRSNSFIRTS